MTTSHCIPDYIITDMLSRIPLKSLLLFKIACKSWYSLISSPYLINLYSKRSPQNPKILFQTKDLRFLVLDPETLYLDEFSFSNLEFRLESHCLKILGSSCGLVCLASGHEQSYGFCFGHFCDKLCGSGLFLWNPFTQELRKTPYMCSLVVDSPWDPRDPHGFEYDPVSNDLKLSVSKYGSTCNVLSMKSNSWKSITCDANSFSNIYEFIGDPKATIVNGVFYWLRKSVNDWSLEIMAFDSTEDKFLNRKVPQTESFLQSYSACLLEHKGYLCISFFLPQPNTSIGEIWLLREQEWIRLLSVSSKSEPWLAYLSSPICISKSSSQVIWHDKNHVLRYLKEEEKLEQICVDPFTICDATMCFETLISPNQIVRGY